MNIIYPFEMIIVSDGASPEFPLDLLDKNQRPTILQWNTRTKSVDINTDSLDYLILDCNIDTINKVNDICYQLLLKFAELNNPNFNRRYFIVAEYKNKYGVAIL